MSGSRNDRRLPSRIGPADPHGPLEVLWRPGTVMGVILAGQGFALVLSLASFGDGGRLVTFGLASLVIQWVSLLTLGVLYAARKRMANAQPLQVAWIALAILVLAAALTGLLGAWLLPTVMSGRSLAAVTFQVAALAAVVGLMGLAAFNLFYRSTLLTARAQRAQLESLQARIRPHFLFNTLNTGAALVHERPETAERVLLDLADLFRAALSGPELIDVAEELDLARQYLRIEQLRFGARLRVQWEVPEVLPKAKLPALSLQPLVENAVLHGVEPQQEGGDLLVQVMAGRRTLQILVQNSVAPGTRKQSPGHSIGLASVRARVEALGPGRARVEISPGERVYRVAVVLVLD